MTTKINPFTGKLDITLGLPSLNRTLNSQMTTIGTDAATTEKDLLSYTLPASTLDAAGKGVHIQAWGATAVNINSKTVRLKFGASIIDSVVTTTSGAIWSFDFKVFREAAAVERVTGQHLVNNALVQVADSALAVSLTAAVIIKITGQNAIAAANDIVAHGLVISYLGT